MTEVVSRLWTAATAALFAACGALVAMALGGALLPEADSLNIFAPFWLAAAVTLLLMVTLIGRCWRPGRADGRKAVAFLACALLSGAFLLSPLGGGGVTSPESQFYRLISFNMYKANADPERVARWILSERADFVVLLEVSPANRSALVDLQQRFPFHYDCVGNGHCSTYILSRFPAERVWPLAHGDADNRRALSALTARFRLKGGALAITAVHLDHPWPLGNQRNEIASLARDLAAIGRNGVVAGDFNSAPWTFAIRRLAGAADVRLVSGALGTWPTGATAAIFRLPLDQIYASRCLPVHAIRQGPALGSDHFPLVADLGPGNCYG